jgi:hypothetical protein
MPYEQHFIVEGKHLGSAVRPLRFIDHGQRIAAPSSQSFFCSLCGDVYAKFPVTNTDTGEVHSFTVNYGICRKCPSPGNTVPGSVKCLWDSDLEKYYPDEVLKGEFLRHLDFLEKGAGQ